jgi:spore coat protein U-like protein
MKRSSLALALVATGLMASASAFAASATHDLAVSATVTGNCRFNAASGTTLTLANSGGAIDPSVATDATGTANVLYRCTKGTVASVAAGDGLHFSGGSRRVSLDASNYMPYSLSMSGCTGTGTGHGAGQDLTCAVSGTITATNHQNATAGAYNDTVVLSITP